MTIEELMDEGVSYLMANPAVVAVEAWQGLAADSAGWRVTGQSGRSVLGINLTGLDSSQWSAFAQPWWNTVITRLGGSV